MIFHIMALAITVVLFIYTAAMLAIDVRSFALQEYKPITSRYFDGRLDKLGIRSPFIWTHYLEKTFSTEKMS